MCVYLFVRFLLELIIVRVERGGGGVCCFEEGCRGVVGLGCGLLFGFFILCIIYRGGV